jgi:hypothetical protein
MFWYIRKIFLIFRKKYDISGKFFLVCPENFFEMTSSPLPPPPQLLEASYAPGEANTLI